MMGMISENSSSALRASRRARGFTLIEVLVVVAVIALLIAILLPSLNRAREQARTAVCIANLHHIGHGMNMYRSDNRGWLPVGPPDKLSYLVYDPNRQVYEYVNPLPPGMGYRRILPWSNCHWGGRRAALIHYYDSKAPRLPEQYKRPLTDYLYRGASLDRPTPLFECPSDTGPRILRPDILEKVSATDHLHEYDELVGRPLHYICGNSYSINPWSEYDALPKKRMRSPSSIVLAEEGDMEYERRYNYIAGEGRAWHGQVYTYSTLFLDMHAGMKTMPPKQFYGPGWYLPSYFQIMDYYR